MPAIRRAAARCSRSAAAPTQPVPATRRSATSARRARSASTMAGPIVQALHAGAYHYSLTNRIWGARANICVPLQNALFLLGAAPRRVRATGPATTRTARRRRRWRRTARAPARRCSRRWRRSRSATASSSRSPARCSRSRSCAAFLGPQDMQTPSDPLPPWLLPHMNAPFRFIDGLAEDMLGYIFPSGNAVGIPTLSNLGPSDTDRFGCGHSDDSEAVSRDIGQPDRERARGRAGRARLRRPRRSSSAATCCPAGRCPAIRSAGPRSSASLDQTFTAAAHPASAVRLAIGQGRASEGVDVAQRTAPETPRPRHARLLRLARPAGVAQRVPEPAVKLRALLAGGVAAIALASPAQADFPYAPGGNRFNPDTFRLAPGVAPNDFSESGDWKLAAHARQPARQPADRKGQSPDRRAVRDPRDERGRHRHRCSRPARARTGPCTRHGR